MWLKQKNSSRKGRVLGKEFHPCEGEFWNERTTSTTDAAYCQDLSIRLFLSWWGSLMLQFSSVQSLSRDRLFATPWIAARQASLSITNSRSSLRLTSIESVMPSSHLILCHPLLLLPPMPHSIRVFSNESTLRMRCQSTGVSALASFLPKKSQGWSPSEWTGWISLQSKGLSRVFSNTTVQKHQFFSAQLSSKSILDYWKNHSLD